MVKDELNDDLIDTLLDNDNVKEIERDELDERLYINDNELEESREVSNDVNRSSNENVKICRPISKNYEREMEIGGINSRGENSIDNSSIRSKFFDEVTPNTQYIVSRDGFSIGVNVSQYDNNQLFISRTYYHYGTFITSSNTRYVRVQLVGSLDDKIQLEENSVVSPYEPYEGCLYGLDLYDSIETNFITNNYYINCGIIATFLFIIVLIVNAPFWFIRKVRGN